MLLWILVILAEFFREILAELIWYLIAIYSLRTDLSVVRDKFFELNTILYPFFLDEKTTQHASINR